MSEVKLLLDEDCYAIKKREFIEKYGKDAWRIKVKEWMEFSDFIRTELYKTGKISKITFNRFRRCGLRIFNFCRDDLIMPNKFNEMYGMKPVNLKYFYNALNKIKKELTALRTKK